MRLPAQRVSVPITLFPLALVPLFISSTLTDPVSTQRHVLALSVASAWFFHLVACALGRRVPLARWSGCDTWVILYGAMIGVSVAFSPDRTISLIAALPILAMIAFYFLVAETGRCYRAFLGRVAAVLLAIGSIVAVIGIGQYFGFDVLAYTERRQVEKLVVLSTLGHPNFVASFLGPICLLGLWRLLEPLEDGVRGVGLRRLLSGVAVALQLACIVFTGARGVWLALFLVAPVTLALLVLSLRRDSSEGVTRAGLPWKALAIVGAIVPVIVVLLLVPNPVIKSRFNLVERIKSGSEIQSRLFYWAVAGEMAAEKPFTGVGYHQYSVLFWPYVEKLQSVPRNDWYREYLLRAKPPAPGEAHNEYVETAAEMGLPGLAVLLGMILWFAASAWRQCRKDAGLAEGCAASSVGRWHRRIIILLGAGAIVLIDALFSFPLQLPASGLLFWTVLGLLRAEIVRENG